MFNLYGEITGNSLRYRQLRCGESLISYYNCPLENKFEDAWSHHNYIVYVIEGRKIWHTTHGSFDLKQGDCVFVRKGAYIIEQFFDVNFCLVLFFLPDDFICEVLKTRRTPLGQANANFGNIIPLGNTPSVHTFFHSMIPYFEANKEPDASLLELKFRELILTLAEDPLNQELISFFVSLLQSPQQVSLRKTMEDNFSYNLGLDEFARLSARSLSAFKRDFRLVFNNTPGKWLLERRLNHSYHLLANQGKTVAEASFESGFENPSHFSRAFRQRFGKPPASVRRKSIA